MTRPLAPLVAWAAVYPRQKIIKTRKLHVSEHRAWKNIMIDLRWARGEVGTPAPMPTYEQCLAAGYRVVRVKITAMEDGE